MEHDLTPRYAHPNDLILHPENARKGNLDELKRSLSRNGQYKPVVVSKQTGYVVAGNHTTKALRELGADRVAYVVVDIDATTERRILAADNRIGDLGSYDNELLIELLESFSGDLDGTGYTDVDLDVLRDVNSGTDEDDEDFAGPEIVTYGAVVECDSLAEQRKLVAHLRENGLDARPLKRE
jgi:hypothetical protein